MRTFANLIRVLFSGDSPFYLALKSDLICSLAKWPEIAKAKVAPTTLAAIMWAVFMQSRHFAHGRMISADPTLDPKTCPEWATMIMKIKGGKDFTLLSAPLPLSGKQVPLPPHPSPLPPAPLLTDNPFEPPTKTRCKTCKIHPLIKKHLTDIIPYGCSIRKLAGICSIKPSAIFPGGNIYINAALRGSYSFAQCRNIHNSDAITDTMAKHAIAVLDKVIQDPKLLAG